MFGFPPLKRPFHKIAKDADLGRPDRRLALTEPQFIYDRKGRKVARVVNGKVFKLSLVKPESPHTWLTEPEVNDER